MLAQLVWSPDAKHCSAIGLAAAQAYFLFLESIYVAPRGCRRPLPERRPSCSREDRFGSRRHAFHEIRRQTLSSSWRLPLSDHVLCCS